MPTVALYNMQGEQNGTIELSDAIFGQEINKAVLHQVVVNYLANQRQGTQSTKTRTEVRGGGIKPWRQKGTGRARQGSIRAPQWTGGGVALGPKPRDYRYRLNKKVRRLAVKSALSAKMQAEEIIVVEDLKMDEIKTATIAKMLKDLGIDSKALIVTAENDQNIYRSARNIKGVTTSYVGTLNTYEILKHDKFVVSKDAIAKIEEVLA
jgi:large subunit ribosomal protein L4